MWQPTHTLLSTYNDKPNYRGGGWMGNVWMAITVIAHTNQGSTGCLMPQPHINMYLHCNNYYFKCERFNEGLSSGLTWLETGNGWTVKWFSRSNCSHFMEEVLYLETIIISWNSRLSQCPEEFSNDTYEKWYCGLLALFCTLSACMLQHIHCTPKTAFVAGTLLNTVSQRSERVTCGLKKRII